MPLLVREKLKKIGDEAIIKLQLGRTPVQSVVRTLGDFLSQKRFSNAIVELGVSPFDRQLRLFIVLPFLQYDELWHNYLLITIRSSVKFNTLAKLVRNSDSLEATKVYVLEKAPRVQLKRAMPEQCVQLFDIPLRSNCLTVNELMRRAICLNPSFFVYDALNMNTCQSFVEDILEANDLTEHIVDGATLSALQPQNATALLSALGSLKGLPLVITDAASQLDKLINDQSIRLKVRERYQHVNRRYL